MVVFDKRRILTGINVLAILEWMIVLKDSDSFYSGYLFLGGIAIVSMLMQKTSNLEFGAKTRLVIRGLGMILSLAVALANYSIIVTPIYWVTMLYAGYVAAEKVLFNLYIYLSNVNLTRIVKRHNQYIYIYILTFLAIAGANISYLILSNYPGSLSPDSISQIDQILTGEYSNHHPYWHTRFVGIFVQLGLRIFHDLSAAIALYNVVQIMLMAACFAFAVMTLYQTGVPLKYVMAVIALYAAMPYHIIYSSTIWKDVLFGGAVLLMVVSLYRLISDMGRNWLNTALLCIGLMGTALFRNNGWLALLGSFVIWPCFFGKKQTKVALLFAAVLIVSWGLKNPVLDQLNVEKSNYRESLSIPIQQVARVIALDADITDEQKQELRKVVDVDKIPEWYTPYISDPVKFNVDGEYIRNHKAEFFKLWLDIGLQNPGVYIHAWIEQTKGYWNAGYDYWIWCLGTEDNDLGIMGTEEKAYEGFEQLRWPRILEPLFSIGIHTWVMLVLCVFNCLWGQKGKAYLAIPLLMLIGTLLMATPVHAEFRYAYAIFTVLPTYLMLSIHHKEKVR